MKICSSALFYAQHPHYSCFVSNWENSLISFVIQMYRAFKIEMKMIRRELWKQLRRLKKTVKNENHKHRKFCSKCRKILANSDTLSGDLKRPIRR